MFWLNGAITVLVPHAVCTTLLHADAKYTAVSLCGAHNLLVHTQNCELAKEIE
jgi:hypothetical protein